MTIKVEDAISNLKNQMMRFEEGTEPDLALKMAIEALKERKTGKWEIYVISMLDGEGCRCSECGFEGAPYWHYCPNCGAKMEGVKE